VALNVHEVANGNDNLLDLLSELTGGCEDESLASLEVGIDLLESRDGEGCSLAGAGLSLSDDIGALEIVSLDQISKWRGSVPLMTGMMARCWIAEGRSKP
jgi:hypothetical protein